MDQITQLLNVAAPGDPQAAATVLPLVYEELRKLAAARLARERGGQTIQATELVHEAWLRVAHDQPDRERWHGRGHFFAAAAEAMRWILVDRARRKLALRRGGGQEKVPLDDLEIVSATPDEQLLEIHEVLDQLAAHDPAKAELVKLRYFAGLTIDEAADVMGFSAPTAKRHWAYARAWLFRALEGLQGAPAPPGAPKP